MLPFSSLSYSLSLLDVIHVVFQLLLSSVPKNVEIVANKMIFNKDGVVIGFQEPLIHSANKGVTAVQTCDHLKNKLTVTLLIYLIYNNFVIVLFIEQN